MNPTSTQPFKWEDHAADVAVVIPAYNEGPVIASVIESLKPLGVSVVVIDDCSTDDTLKQLQGTHATVLKHAINLGQGAALQTGLSYARLHGAKYVVTFDADGQHDHNDIPKLIETLCDEEVDVVLGSRFLGEAIDMPTARRWLLKAAILFTYATTGLRLSDVHNGFRGFKLAAVPHLNIRQNRMAHASEILSLIADQKLRYKEIPSTVRYTEHSMAKGQSALGAFDIVFELVIARFI